MDAHLTIDIPELIRVGSTLKRVDALKVTGCFLGCDKAFVALPLVATLIELDLSRTELTDTALKTVLEHAPRLTKMNVANNQLTQRGLDALCSRTPPFESLDVRGNAFEDPHDWSFRADTEWTTEHDEVRRTPQGELLEHRFGVQPWLREVK